MTNSNITEGQERLFEYDESSGLLFSSEIERLCYLPEGQYFDRKRAKTDPGQLDRHFSALANSNGGTLVIGIADDGKITGFKEDGANPIEVFEQAPIMLCSPPPEFRIRRIPVQNVNGENDVVLVIEIEGSSNRVIRSSRDSNVYLRNNDSSRRLTHDQITSLEYSKNERAYEDQQVHGATLDCIDQDVVEHYKELRHSTNSIENILRARNFLRNGELTVAGVLLFAKSPSNYLPTARVRFIRFDGNKMETGRRLNITKSLEFSGPIPSVLKEARNAINDQLREFQYLNNEGRFSVIPEYPEFAWFEGLVNALTHRDYSYSGDTVRVSMYDDRLEILSPGSLPNIVTLQNMKRERYSRNPKIAQTLCDFGWVRELNEGVNRIYDEMQRFFLNDPVYSEPEGNHVKLVLENSITSRALRGEEGLSIQLDQETISSLNEYEFAAVQFVYSKGRITTKTLSAAINRGTTLSGNVLKGLEAKEILVWHGSNPTDPSQFYSFK